MDLRYFHGGTYVSDDRSILMIQGDDPINGRILISKPGTEEFVYYKRAAKAVRQSEFVVYVPLLSLDSKGNETRIEIHVKGLMCIVVSYHPEQVPDIELKVYNYTRGYQPYNAVDVTPGPQLEWLAAFRDNLGVLYIVQGNRAWLKYDTTHLQILVGDPDKLQQMAIDTVDYDPVTQRFTSIKTVVGNLTFSTEKNGPTWSYIYIKEVSQLEILDVAALHYELSQPTRRVVR